jgi:hypothetical protein
MTTVPPSSPNQGSQIRPKVAWVVFAVVLMVAGPAGCLVGVATNGLDLVNGFDEFGRYRLPISDQPVRFDERVGDGAMFVDANSSRTGDLATFRLVDDAGHSIHLRPVLGSNTFSYSNGTTKADLVEVARFEVTSPGQYQLTASSGENGPDEIWLGRHLSSARARPLLVAVFGGGFVGLVGLVLLVIFLVRRGRSRRQLQGWGGPPGYGGGGPGYPASPQPGYGYPPPQPGYAPPPGPPGYAPPPGQPGQPGYAPPPGQPGQPGYAPPPSQPGYAPPPSQPGYGNPPGQPGAAPPPSWAPPAPPPGWAPPAPPPPEGPPHDAGTQPGS